MKQKLLFVALTIFMAVATTSAQTAQVMTNANVIKLVKGKMDNDIILSKMETSPCKFDLSDDALMNLKSSGVPLELIKAMIEKSNGKKTIAKAESPAAVTPAKITSGLQPATLNEVYYVDPVSNTLKDLEKGKAAMTQKVNMITGKSQANFEMKGAKSPFRISTQDNVAFMVDMSYGDPTGFELYKTELKSGKRVANWTTTSMYSLKSSAGQNIVPVTASRPDGKAFKMVVGKLEKGEYFFLSRLNTLGSAGQSYDVFAFGVD